MLELGAVVRLVAEDVDGGADAIGQDLATADSSYALVNVVKTKYNVEPTRVRGPKETA